MVRRKEGAERAGMEEHGEEETNTGKGVEWKRKKKRKGGRGEEVTSIQEVFRSKGTGY